MPAIRYVVRLPIYDMAGLAVIEAADAEEAYDALLRQMGYLDREAMAHRGLVRAGLPTDPVDVARRVADDRAEFTILPERT